MFKIVRNGSPLYCRVSSIGVHRSFTQYQGFEIEYFETYVEAENLISKGRVFYFGAEILADSSCAAF